MPPAEETGAVLFSLDHHHGSEENQAGWEHHDPSLVSPETGRSIRSPGGEVTIDRAQLEPSVIGIVGDSPTVSAHWLTPLAFCFIDGGHGEGPAWADYRGWAPKVVEDGWLAIHDVFPDPAGEAGRPMTFGWQPSTRVSSSRTESADRCGSSGDSDGSPRIAGHRPAVSGRAPTESSELRRGGWCPAWGGPSGTTSQAIVQILG